MFFRFRLSAILLLLPLFGCTDLPAPPACRTIESTPQQHDTLACIIKADTDTLLWQNAGGLLELPVAQTAETEAEQCTLHREVFVQTGINVEVGKLLLTTKDNMGIYACSQHAGLEGIGQPFAAPAWANDNLSWVKRDAYQLTIRDMQNPDHLIPLRDSLSVLFRQSQTDKE